MWEVMAESKVPYVPAYGNITKALNGIQKASVPERFTQDFLATKLALKGGTPKPVIPFLKRTGFLASDGIPTDLYHRFRNPSISGGAAADALRKGFSGLYEINEYVHDVSDAELKGLIMQATGLDGNSGTVKATLGSFKALRAFADFDAPSISQDVVVDEQEPEANAGPTLTNGLSGLNLGYTINLHLPATSDAAVFNAIFKSLREHLLR